MPSYYKTLTNSRQDSIELKNIMEEIGNEVVCRSKGLDPQTKQQNTSQKPADTSDYPGVLLGQIQSGKTRTFIGVIAYVFDYDFDITVVFTKNSTALVEQTVKRLKTDFSAPVNAGELFIFDVMKASSITKHTLGKKIILVVKKESNNLNRLNKLFKTTHPELAQKRVLIMDDEADTVSVGYYRDKTSPTGQQFAKIAAKISDFRNIIRTPNPQGQSGVVSFLQVTATPYSLYLQPENIITDPVHNGNGYRPIRPAYTFVLEPHQYYVGGKVYFEDSQNPNHYASHVWESIDEVEFSSLVFKQSKKHRKPDDRLRKNIMTTPKLEGFRNSLFKYLIAGTIRILQTTTSEDSDEWIPLQKSAYLIHIDMGKCSHDWEYKLVVEFLRQLTVQTPAAALFYQSTLLYQMVDRFLPDFVDSIQKANQVDPNANLSIPTVDEVTVRLAEALHAHEINCRKVNSDDQIVNLLNAQGQLRLDAPYNIFIGGQSLDRGITIDNLIAFFYGRNPKKFQMDTVLQHARMYGARSIGDMAVTRFYTSERIYESLERMYWFDKALRDDVSNNLHGAATPVVFVQKDKNNVIIPCSPNRIGLSDIVTFAPEARLLPKGFQTIAKSKMKSSPAKKALDTWVSVALNSIGNNVQLATSGVTKTQRGQWTATSGDVCAMLQHVEATLTFKGSIFQSNISVLLEAVRKFSPNDQVRVHYVGFSNISRMKANGTKFSDAPDDAQSTLPQARRDANQTGLPVLMMVHVKGEKSKGWNDTDFYWPVLVLPNNIQTHIYANS